MQVFKKVQSVVAALCLTGLLTAQTDTLIELALPDVVLTENRIELPFSESSRSIEVISQAQIRQAPVQSVAELLHYATGIDVRQRGVHGVQADVSIRGGTFDQTLILVNGIKMSDPQTGHHALNLPVDLESIERIEILKGPGARVFGQNAFTGAINIITKTADIRFVKVGVQGGQNQLGGIRAAVSMPGRQSNHYLSVSRDFSQGYRHNTDYNITNAFYQSDFEGSMGKLQLLAGLTERAFGANGFYASPAATEQFEAVQTSLVSLQGERTNGAWTHQPRLSWRRNQDEYIYIRSNPSIYRNLHIGNTLSAEWHSTRRSDIGQTGIGAELQYVRLQSNNLGTQERYVGSAFFEHRFQWLDGRLDLTPGILFNYFSDFGTNFFPGLDLGFELLENLKVFANVGNTYRVPTFTDLYYQDPANLGNPDLQPESALSCEAGLKGNYRGLQWQTAYFRRIGEDLIDWTKAADTLQWQPQNFGRVQMQGAEASLTLFFPALISADTWLQRLQLNYTYIDAELLETDKPFSRYALENLRHQLTGSVEYRIGKRLYHSVYYRYYDRVTLDNYALVDTRLQYRSNKLRVFAEAANLLDVEYTETNLVPMPGRWIRAGVEITWR